MFKDKLDLIDYGNSFFLLTVVSSDFIKLNYFLRVTKRLIIHMTIIYYEISHNFKFHFHVISIGGFYCTLNSFSRTATE